MKKFVILDLDNTISDDSWRMPHIAWQHTDPNRRYHDYHLLAAFDNLRNDALIEQWEKEGADFIISTARPTMFRAITLEWLLRMGMTNVARVMMRNDSDKRSSVEIKRDHVRWLIDHEGIDPLQIVHAYDDREDICAMFREFGIPATRKPIHDICAMTPPGAKR